MPMYETFRTPGTFGIGKQEFSITDEGIIIKGKLVPYTQIERLKQFSEAGLLTSGVYQVYVTGKPNPELVTYLTKDLQRAKEAFNFANKKLREEGPNKFMAGKERRMRCNVCGHVYCYTFADLEKNKQLMKDSLTDSLLSVGESLAGTRMGSYMASNSADEKKSQIIDYSKCPKCHSADVVEIGEDEVVAPQSSNTQTASSTADEIKKFKDLLDAGVITQEEFDAKKKQLLGL